MREEYTNSSIARKIELYNSYFAQISIKKATSKKLGFIIVNPIWAGFLQFLNGQGILKGALIGIFRMFE